MHIPSILLLALIEFAFSLPINLHAFPKVDCRLAHCAEGVDCCTLPHDPGADPELTIITGPFSGNPVPLPGLGGDPGAPFDKRDNALEKRIVDGNMPLEKAHPRGDTHGCSDGCHTGGSGGGFPDLPKIPPDILKDES